MLLNLYRIACCRPQSLIVGGVIASTCLWTVGCQGTPAGGAPTSRAKKPVLVQTVSLKAGRMPRLLPAVGTLESPQTTAIASEVSGVVTFLDIPEGSEIEAGRVLARVDDRQAQAQLAVATARYKNASDTYDRLLALHASGLISRQELDDAASSRDQAAGELKESQTTLNQREVRAPFSGQLGLREISLGAFVDAGDSFVTLTQTDPLRLVFTLPERDATQVRPGQSIRGVAGDCTQRFETSVKIIDPSIDPRTRAIRAQASVDNPKRNLRAGMSARIVVQVGEEDAALTVPQEAVVRRGTRKMLFVVANGNEVEEREIEIGQHFAERVEVLSGVKAGETVVVAGHQRIRSGSTVEQQPYKAIKNPKLALGQPALTCDL